MKMYINVILSLVIMVIGTQAYASMASWYGGSFHGKRTASGERYNMNAMTAAHKTLPFGSKVRVTNKENGRSVIVKINDRGPFVANRVIDLSRKANKALGCDLCKVSLKVISRGNGKYKRN